jgi:hypothetical protein
LTGYWTIVPRAGTPGPPEDSQALLRSSIEDVRCAAPSSGCPITGADYAGELQVRISTRISDHYNAVAVGPSYTDPATVPDVDFGFDIPCGATSNPDIGATCGYHSEIGVFYPGLLKDGKRMIMEIGQVRIADGGDDGDVQTDDGAQTFLTEGVFIP